MIERVGKGGLGVIRGGLAFLVLLAAGQVSQASNTCTLIVNTNATVPNTGGKFKYAEPEPGISGARVVFRGFGFASYDSIYAWVDGEIVAIADTNTLIPGTGVPFEACEGNPSISGENAAFRGMGGEYDGLYARLGTSMIVVVDADTLIPGTSETFSDWCDHPSISGTNVVFAEEYVGVYLRSGTNIIVVADTNTTIPGSSYKFDFFDDDQSEHRPVISGDNVAFVGGVGGGLWGVYATITGSLVTIADTETYIPGTSERFESFVGPAISGENVAFSAYGEGTRQGVYARIGTNLVTIADTNTTVPGSSGKFRYFMADDERPGIHADTVAFRAEAWAPAPAQGIYAWIAGTLVTVAATNTAIPEGGDTFQCFHEGPSVGEEHVAFHADSKSYSSGIYMVWVDSDDDGMSDIWEGRHFETLARDGTGDLDEDGQSDFNEYRSGTVPTNAASVFQTAALEMAGEPNALVRWTSEIGKTYTVHRATDLSAGFAPVSGVITATPPLNTYTATVGGLDRAFFKVGLED